MIRLNEDTSNISKIISEDIAIKRYTKNKADKSVVDSIISTIAISFAVVAVFTSGLMINYDNQSKDTIKEVVKFDVFKLEKDSKSTDINTNNNTVETKKYVDTDKTNSASIVNACYYSGSEYVTLESEKDLVSVYDRAIKVNDNIKTGFEEPEEIRCTFYTDHGYTKSGTYTRPGVLAGKKEWLGKTCVLYAINEDGSIGEVIGTYEFLDTGAGINGTSLKDGSSIDMWFSTYAEGDSFRDKYGDYVYMQMVENNG